MTDTPGEMSRSDARRIAQETAALIDDDRGYRERVLTSLVRLETKVDALQESFKDHVKEDESRFGTVNQRIASNTSWISKGTGIIAAVVVMLGVIMWVVDKVSP